MLQSYSFFICKIFVIYIVKIKFYVSFQFCSYKNFYLVYQYNFDFMNIYNVYVFFVYIYENNVCDSDN